MIYGIIYKIKNKINNKIYIGQTTRTFDERYRNNLYKNTHNSDLKDDIEKYGIENFEIDKEFDVAYSKEELDKLEKMYIVLYKLTDKRYGYNKCVDFNTIPKTNKRMSKILENGKQIINLDNGDIFLSLSTAVEYYKNISYDNLANYLNGGINYTTTVTGTWETLENFKYGLDEAFGFNIDLDCYFEDKVKEAIDHGMAKIKIN